MIDIKIFLQLLKKHYPSPKCALNFSCAFELLVATILSAQSTDVQVNKVTPELFKKYRNPSDYYLRPPEELEKDIYSTGFYKNKAKSIRETAKMIDEKFGGKVPDNMDDLLLLRGVARKTANVVLGSFFGKAEGIVVDTHVLRLANRMGLTQSKNPEKAEKDLMRHIPKKNWIYVGHALVLHGRALCMARKPACIRCFLNEYCPKIGV